MMGIYRFFSLLLFAIVLFAPTADKPKYGCTIYAVLPDTPHVMPGILTYVWQGEPTNREIYSIRQIDEMKKALKDCLEWLKEKDREERQKTKQPRKADDV